MMRYTPIAPEYARHQGRVVDFHGWGLPLHFFGIIEEHAHVRSQAGVFDCSHMGEFVVRGDTAIAALSDMVVGDLVALPVGRCRYTALVQDDGGIIDDCVAMKPAHDELMLVTNAGPLHEVAALLEACVPGVENISHRTAKIDVQGPLAFQVLQALGFDDIRELGFWNVKRREDGVIVARAGYTGELGYELYTPNSAAVSLWRALMELSPVMPCGLGARDTLRTEMGYPLSGQDVTKARTPLEAGMERFIAWHTEFPGKQTLLAQRDSGDYQVLTPLRSPDRRAPRSGYVLRHDGRDVGEVTSGTFGPSVQCGIGLGYVPRALAQPGTSVQAGPREQTVIVEKPPLYKDGSGRNPVT